MKSSENNLPSSVAEENKSHNWIWRFSTIAVILPLIFVGAILNSISSQYALGFIKLSPLCIAASYIGWILFAWLCILLPAILIRAICGRRLHWSLSLLLAFAGLILMIMANQVVFGNSSSPKGSILLILLIGSAYKVAHSHFWLQSIGIPLSLPKKTSAQDEMKESLPRKKEDPLISEKFIPIPSASPVETHHTEDLFNFSQVESTPSEQPTVAEVKAVTSKFSRFGICCLFLYGIALSVLLMLICVRSRYQWREDAVLEVLIISLICILIPCVCGKLMRDAASKAIRSYQKENPVNAISYGVITCVLWIVWYAIILGVISMGSKIWKSDIIYNGEFDSGAFILPIVLQVISYIIVPRLLRIGINPVTKSQVWKIIWSGMLTILSLGLCALGIHEWERHAEKLRYLQSDKIETHTQLQQARSATLTANKHYDAYLTEIQQRNKRRQQIYERQKEIDKKEIDKREIDKRESLPSSEVIWRLQHPGLYEFRKAFFSER